ncbi:hypothetical protein B1A87_007150 [Arthrobacter sp. KBS0703]|uniref:hypothetical protein n=1 Tax=Arthrobacter sp. KBS0703 TaxID=1955698 RepID=UPI0009C86186|nr:hypothetical protein [Arthrobacter sp. KBS0703]TSE15712.1 hypothetical protein B1A87_007150 [Arthrobacter sp. KBS0703]
MAQQSRGRKQAGRPAGPGRGAIEPFTAQTVDAALKSQAHRAVRHVVRLRNEHPDLSDADILKKLESKFRRDAFEIGRKAGAAAASEGTAPTATVDTIAGRLTLESAVFFVLAATEAYEVPLAELEDREDLVRAVLLAEGTNKAVRRLASRAAPHVARKIVVKIPASSFKPINDAFGYRIVTKRGQTGDIVLEDAAAKIAGSLIGIGTHVLFTQNVIRVTKRTLEGIREASGRKGDVLDEPVEVVDEGTSGPDLAAR